MAVKGADDVLQFWFVEHGRDDWFGGKPEFDAELAAAFTETHAAVARGEAWTWRGTPEGRLAEVIVLDQFSRQLFRKQPQAFAYDGMALALAQEAVAGGHDLRVPAEQRPFFYLPHMHSESLLIHDEAMRLYTALGVEELIKFEVVHRDLIVRFGRYPRRNAALGRESTAEELDYINSGEGMF